MAHNPAADLESEMRETVSAMAVGGGQGVSTVLPSVRHYDDMTAQRVQADERPYNRVAEQRQGSASTKRNRSWFGACSMAGVSSAGDNKENQDAFLIMPQLGEDPGIALFGVFDGHGVRGDAVSGLCKLSAVS